MEYCKSVEVLIGRIFRIYGLWNEISQWNTHKQGFVVKSDKNK